MSFICVRIRSWSTDAASDAEWASALLDLAPRVLVEPDRVWVDGRGLDAARLAGAVVARLEALGAEGVWAGVGSVPVVARCAAESSAGARQGASPSTSVRGRARDGMSFVVKERTGWGHRHADPIGPESESESDSDFVVVVEAGGERSFLAGLDLAVLEPEPAVATLLEGVGIGTLGALAALRREAVEVRFGPEGLRLWRLARADDPRRLFRRIPAERPHASLDFVDYVLTDPARLVFTANGLLSGLCEGLLGRGEHARSMELELPLANGERWTRRIRPARPTASRERWLRLIRGLLERITVPDAVTGMALTVEATEPAAVRQGDLFDRGFATASAVEAAVARLVEQQGPVLREPEVEAHPLAERRARWAPATVAPAVAGPGAVAGARGAESAEAGAVEVGVERGPGALTLQLLPEPRRIQVDLERRRDHEAPVRLRDRGGWQEVVLAAGPDRVSGGQWEPEPYAREYFRCVTGEGVLLWIYRDGCEAAAWYLHGWWD